MPHQITKITNISNELLNLIDDSMSFYYKSGPDNKPVVSRTDLLGRKELSKMIENGEMYQLVFSDENEDGASPNLAKPSPKLIGCMSITIRDTTKMYLGLLCIDRNHRNQGLGKMMMDFAENKAGKDIYSSIKTTELVGFYHKDCQNSCKISAWYDKQGYVGYKSSYLFDSEVIREQVGKVVRDLEGFKDVEKEVAIESIYRYNYEIIWMRKDVVH